MPDGGQLLVLFLLPVHKLDAPHHQPADAAHGSQKRGKLDDAVCTDCHFHICFPRNLQFSHNIPPRLGGLLDHCFQRRNRPYLL